MPSALQRSQEMFIRRWGEMAGYWGINRTMAEIHALLYICERALCMDEIMERVQISRGSVSMNLRHLMEWDLVRRVHQPAGRKEYFLAETDVWRIFEAITRHRKRRELEPIIETIRRARDMVKPEMKGLSDPQANRARIYHTRLKQMLEFLETVSGLFNVVQKLGPARMLLLTKMAGRPTGPDDT